MAGVTGSFASEAALLGDATLVSPSHRSTTRVPSLTVILAGVGVPMWAPTAPIATVSMGPVADPADDDEDKEEETDAAETWKSCGAFPARACSVGGQFDSIVHAIGSTIDA